MLKKLEELPVKSKKQLGTVAKNFVGEKKDRNEKYIM